MLTAPGVWPDVSVSASIPSGDQTRTTQSSKAVSSMIFPSHYSSVLTQESTQNAGRAMPEARAGKILVLFESIDPCFSKPKSWGPQATPALCPEAYFPILSITLSLRCPSSEWQATLSIYPTVLAALCSGFLSAVWNQTDCFFPELHLSFPFPPAHTFPPHPLGNKVQRLQCATKTCWTHCLVFLSFSVPHCQLLAPSSPPYPRLCQHFVVVVVVF